MSKVPSRDLADVPYPACSKRCLAIEYLGVGECSSICPQKFPEEQVKTAMDKLTDEQRLVIISNYCRGCGGHLPCHCNNDE